MRKISLKGVIKYLGNMVTILSIIFIIRVAISFNIDFSIVHNKSLFVIILFLGILVMCTTVFILAYGWKCILNVLSQKSVNFFQAATVYAKANMGKYLPGNVMHYVERNLFASSLGLDQRSVLLSTITEIVGLMSVCIIVGIITEKKEIVAILKSIIQKEYLVFLLFLVVAMCFFVLFFREKIKKVLSEITWSLFLKGFIRAIPTYFFFVLLGGSVLASLFQTIGGTSMAFGIILKILSAYTIAWVIGFVVPGSPGGIGVREFVLLFLLKKDYTEKIILTCILIHRLISVLGDILAYLLTLAWNKLIIKFVRNERL